MNRYEADLTLRGLEIATAHLGNDIPERDRLVQQFMGDIEFQRLADAFTYTAILGVEMTVPARRVDFDTALRDVQRDDTAVLLPDLPMPYEEATWLASAAKHGGENNPQQVAASTMDQPGAVNATFQLMISAFRTLARTPGLPIRTAAAWARELHRLLEQGHGVDD